MTEAAQAEATTVPSPSEPPPRERLWVLDLILLAGIGLFVVRAWSWGALRSEISSDAFMALECGWRFLESGFARPSQQLFGYGVCAMMAPLFVGADSLWEVAIRRSMVGGAVVPIGYLMVLLSASRIASLSPLATRVAALTAAILIARNEPLGHATMSGGHGYFAFTCIATAMLFWAIALRRRARVLCALGFVLVPLAMMNHPYSGWLLFVGLAFIPGFRRHTGLGAVVVGLLAGLAVAWPRISDILHRLGQGDSFADLVGAGGDQNIEGVFSYVLVEISTLPITIGVIVLAVLAFRAFRAGEAGEVGARDWGFGLAGGLLAWLILFFGIGGYVRDYHVIQLYPFGVLGWGVALGLVYDRVMARWAPAPGALRRFGPAALIVVLSLGTLRFAGGLSEADPPRSLAYRVFLGASFEPWRTPGALMTTTAGGNHFYERAILKDIRDNVASDVPVLVTNFNPAVRREDSSVALALSLHLSGLPKHRVSCCHPDQPPPVWYWVVDTQGASLDYAGLVSIEGVEVLAGLPTTEELLMVFRSAEALAEVGARLCAELPADQKIAVHYYRDWLTLVNSSGNPGYIYPPPPLPECMLDRLL